MKKVKVENCAGMALAHDVTRIIPGRFKGPGFKKGHIVRTEDIPELIKIGKNHIYALDLSKSQLHEDDAALRICDAICRPAPNPDLESNRDPDQNLRQNLEWTPPSEGKSNIISSCAGTLKVNEAGLLEINEMDDVILSTLKTNFPCQKGQTVAATRIIPLVISKTKINALSDIAARRHPILRIMPWKTPKIGAVVTGTEICNGLIHDEFDAYVGKTVSQFGCQIDEKIVVPDDASAISQAIFTLVDHGNEMIITTGGLSVDPDDVTKKGILETGATLISYGSPILPGAMFLYAKLNEIPIIGLPACVYYHRATIFNIVFPRLLAGDDLTKTDIDQMGHGGLCMNCEVCRYPICPFGK